MPVSCLKEFSDEISREDQQCRNCSLVNDIHVHATGEHAFTRASWLLLHGIAFAFFHSQSESRKRIGDQIDPEQVCRLQDGEVQYRCNEDRQHLAYVGCEQELNRLSDVRVDAASLFNCRNDRSEVVVCKYHVSDVLCDVSTGDAHAHADVGGLDGRRVVDAVSRHGCYHPSGAPCLYNPYLMLRLHPRIYRVCAHLVEQFFITHVVECRSEYSVICALNDPQILADGDSCIELVACYHDRSDACRTAFSNSILYFRSDRIDHSQESYENEVVLEGLIREIAWSLMVNTGCE